MPNEDVLKALHTTEWHCSRLFEDKSLQEAYNLGVKEEANFLAGVFQTIYVRLIQGQIQGVLHRFLEAEGFDGLDTKELGYPNKKGDLVGLCEFVSLGSRLGIERKEVRKLT